MKPKPFLIVVSAPSGAGKTSLLDAVAGLRRPESGVIRFDGEVLTRLPGGPVVPPRLRGIGYVPQDLALFPHLSVRRNVLYGATRSPTPRFRLESIAELLEILPLLDRPVTSLSGGERQRVALARALTPSPRLLLLDEPLASLDDRLKGRVLPYLARVRDDLGLPMLYVTHDRAEAAAIGQRFAILDRGRILQEGGIDALPPLE